jgi:hypothetical protein
MKENGMQQGRRPARMPATGWMLAAGLGLLFAGCRRDCGETARMGDFEFSQGNYANALKRYEQALRMDPHCHIAGDKLAEARRRAASDR